MKKIIVGLLFFVVLFAGCQMPNNTPDSGNNNNSNENTQDLAAIAVYNKLVGTKWEVEVYEGTKKSGYPDVIIFADDSITMDNVQFSINKNEFCFYEYSTASTQGMTLKLNNITWALHLYSSVTNPLYADYKDCTITLWKDSENNTTVYQDYKFVSSSSQSAGGDTSSVNGTYSFNNATGTQKEGSIILSDGNWTYSGSKTNAPSGGTYTVSGSDITFSWTVNGYSVSTTVTVSKSGSSVTLSSNEVVFFSTFFNSTAQSDGKYSLTFSYSEQMYL